MQQQRAVRGGWLFEDRGQLTLAQRLNGSELVELTGELHKSVWARDSQWRDVAALMPVLGAALEAMQQPDEGLSLGSLLQGARWGLLFLELTGRCNENCLHCYASSSPQESRALNWSTLARLIDEAGAMGFATLQLTGGDPLLSPHLFPALERAQAVGIEHLEVYTNGLAFKKEWSDRFAQLGVSMAVSVYSHRPEVHDAITRTPGSLERTLRAIDWAQSAGVRLRIGVVLRAENRTDGDALLSFLESRGISKDCIGIDRERPVGRGNWDEGSAEAYGQASYSLHSSVPRQEGSGKLAVTYDGRLVPCVFDRSQQLGDLSSGASMASILAQPVAFLPNEAGVRGLPLAGQPLACGDCQERKSLLKRLRLSSCG